jgi:hypothetical protein
MLLSLWDFAKVREIALSLGAGNSTSQFGDYLRNQFGIAVPNRRLRPVWSEMRRLRIA